MSSAEGAQRNCSVGRPPLCCWGGAGGCLEGVAGSCTRGGGLLPEGSAASARLLLPMVLFWGAPRPAPSAPSPAGRIPGRFGPGDLLESQGSCGRRLFAERDCWGDCAWQGPAPSPAGCIPGRCGLGDLLESRGAQGRHHERLAPGGDFVRGSRGPAEEGRCGKRGDESAVVPGKCAVGDAADSDWSCPACACCIRFLLDSS